MSQRNRDRASSPTIRKPGQLQSERHSHCIPALNHYLLVLTDSALPLGSFAFSSGLESYVANARPRVVDRLELQQYISFSVASTASTTLPYLLAAYRDPRTLPMLDGHLDASILCQVARRASVAQGRALSSVWERCLTGSVCCHEDNEEAVQVLQQLNTDLRRKSSHGDGICGNGHFPIIWGLVTRAAEVPIEVAAYVYLFKHAQSLLSAAVRASVIGPYQAQALLSSNTLRDTLDTAIKVEWNTPIEDTSQTVPLIEFWMGLHEKLYSRVFNS